MVVMVVLVLVARLESVWWSASGDQVVVVKGRWSGVGLRATVRSVATCWCCLVGTITTDRP